MAINRTDPPLAADELTSLLAFLDYHRDTLRLKADGLDAEQLNRTLAPSTLTLGGLLKHLSLVESNWLGVILLGRAEAEPWASVDWDADVDWDFHSAVDDTPESLRTLFDETVAESGRIIEEVVASDGPAALDRLSVVSSRKEGRQFSLRWILLHLIEEYARHNGHADLLRESIDGQTGE
ncbi:mini-circle protein [Intrasporangium oryzae NRRL B-24470]|uniref:Mini-circle protein n=1 Tax=Intrasporangium oryzae NRRL B-24470 TaxID=1386089 RepID=W9GDJ4_9MICO|nr:DinB family protein [Intrasporangium oryzae]EWT03287.1 mini-circle protein [Intrasporangium oryzae NRRL B-24470]